MTITSIDELSGLVGTPIGAGDWRTIDQDAVDAFAEVTGDCQWIHVDPERASAGPFGTTVAHGFLTLSLCAPALEQALTVQDASMQVNYGLERVRFPAPVPTGTRVRGLVELVAVDEVTGGLQGTLRVTVEIDGQPKPACVADVVVRFYR